MKDKLIYAGDLLNAVRDDPSIDGANFRKLKQHIEEVPTVDAVSRGVFDQVMWERNVAIAQLEEHGIPFGGTAPDVLKVVRCKECKFCTEIGLPRCRRTGRNVIDDDFCSRGERKEDG